MSTTFSPAPWSYMYSPYTVRDSGTDASSTVGDELAAFEVFDADCNKVFDTNEDTPADLQEANARLGSTAPRLLTALIACANLLADYDESEGEEGQAYREAVAAIEFDVYLGLFPALFLGLDRQQIAVFADDLPPSGITVGLSADRPGCHHRAIGGKFEPHLLLFEGFDLFRAQLAGHHIFIHDHRSLPLAGKPFGGGGRGGTTAAHKSGGQECRGGQLQMKPK